MAQHDYNIANQTFPNTRTDINNALSAVASNNSGTAAPSTTFANQWFYETDTNLLQIRNEDNDAYITIAELDQSNDTVEYFKSDSIRTALIEFTDGDDAITIADGGGCTFPIASTFTSGFTSNDGCTITTADNTDTLTLTSTDADANAGPNLRLYRNSSSAAPNDVLGVIEIEGRNDNSEDIVYQQYQHLIADETDGTEDGYLLFSQMKAGTLTERYRIETGTFVINDPGNDFDFRVEGDNHTHLLFVDASADRIGFGNNTSNPGVSFDFRDDPNDIITLMHNTQTSGNVFGMQINFSSTVDDNTSYFFRCVGNNSSTVRAVIFSDGDIQNADNSYGSTSDERIKEQIKDANSQWDDIKALKIKNYKLKEDVADKGDSDDLWRLGVVAQDLEAAGMNGLVKPEVKLDADSPEVIKGEGNVGDIRDYKGVKYSILYMKAVKALQEAMERIEVLESKIN